MLTIGTDPALPLAQREAVFLTAFEALRAAARAQVDESFDDDDARALAKLNGEAAAARDALVEPVGGHRLRVDPDLYATALADDDGLVVLAGDVDDVNPPSVYGPEGNLGTETPAAAEESLAAGDESPATPADEPPAPRKAPAAKAPAKKAAARKSTARKATAKKAPARKAAAAKKSAR